MIWVLVIYVLLSTICVNSFKIMPLDGFFAYVLQRTKKKLYANRIVKNKQKSC